MKRRLSIQDLIGAAVWVLAVEIRNQIHTLKETLMSELDDATNRIVADIDNAVAAIADLRAAIEAAGNAGADVTALNAAADKLEAAVAPPAPPAG